MSPIAYRSYGLDDYLADTTGWNVVQTVHVECGLPPKDQLSETDWLQGLADTRGVIGGIVCGANLDDPDVEPLLEAQGSRANVRGVRQIVNWHQDPAKTYGPTDLLLSDAWRKGYALLAKHGLSFDLQLYPSQMATAAELAGAHPDIPVIVNHAGMPTDRDDAGLAAWRDGLALLAQRPNVSCKISGLAMIDRAWTPDSLRPFVLRVIETFGPDRCMFASNFPVDSVCGDLATIFAGYQEITAGFSAGERAAMFHDNAMRIYRIDG